MPFMKHIIEPNTISQCPLPPGEPNELECLSNLTLANVIRQLSSLGQHAGRIFDELVQDAVKLNSRSQILTQRIDNLKQKCTQLDIQNEEVTLADMQNKKQFKNTVKLDQQVVSRKTMPEAMQLMYMNADPPPSLDKLNPYRTDGKDCMKFYTDPEFFFNIWCNELIKDNETRKNEKKKRRTRGDKQNVKSPQSKPPHTQFIAQVSQKLSYDDTYQHMLLLKQQQQIGLNLNPNHNNNQAQIYQQQNIYQHHQQLLDQHREQSHYNQNGFNDDSLPPPPHQLLQPVNQLNSYQIYAESTNLSNGNRSTKLSLQQANLTKLVTQSSIHNERPVLPPPPIPDNNHLSDLQQIQNQMIRKFDGMNRGLDINQENDHDTLNNDLPPPPSPPNFKNHEFADNPQTHKPNFINYSISHQMTNLTINQKLHSNMDATDSMFDMPLPPPPVDLADPNNIPPPSPPSIPSISNHPPLPPPPPLPPLVESDTVSSSTSSLSTSNHNDGNVRQQPKQQQPHEDTKSSRSFLDDLKNKRFALKPTQKDGNLEDRRKMNSTSDEGGRDSIQPFVNNSDVAAIIDFVRKFRPHVRDSSDEEEDENSDWDE